MIWCYVLLICFCRFGIVFRGIAGDCMELEMDGNIQRFVSTRINLGCLNVY